MEEQRDRVPSTDQEVGRTDLPEGAQIGETADTEINGEQVDASQSAQAESEGNSAPVAAEEEVESTQPQAVPEPAGEEEEEDEEEAQADEEALTEERSGHTQEVIDTLCGLFREKAKQEPVGDVRREVQQIYEALFRKLKLQRDEARREWVSAGGAPGDFVPAGLPVEQELKSIYEDFQRRRRELMAREDSERQENLRKKREIIAKIEELTRQQEVKGETFNRFNELRKEWREIGQVPRAEAEDLYQSYSHQVQQFYDYVDLNRELRNLDYQKNLEAKTELCERAEELIAESDVRKAFRELQTLHSRWKELGPVAREKSDEIWERFSAASSRINQAHREHMQERKAVYAKNLEVRKELVTRMESLLSEKRTKQSEWVASTAQVIELQKAFKEAFPVARSQSNVGDIFYSLCTEFFSRRRAYEKEQEAIGRINVEKKQELCVQAEALRESEKWNDTKEELISLQRKWREVGYTPRKIDQQLWERFKAAQDYFFERRKKAHEAQRAEEQANKKLREALIAEVEAYEPSGDGKDIVEQLKTFQTRWAAIGHVPFGSKEGLYRRFRAELDRHYDLLRHERKEEYAQAYAAKLDSMAEEGGAKGQLTAERNKVNRKLEQLLAEKNQLETNMSFFAQGDQNNPLLQRTRQDVERLEREIESVRRQVKEINLRIRAGEGGKGKKPSREGDK